MTDDAGTDNQLGTPQKGPPSDNNKDDRGSLQPFDETGIVESSISSAPYIQEKPYDSDRHRDAARSYIAYWLLALLTLVIIVSYGIVVWFDLAGKLKESLSFEEIKSFVELTLTPLLTLVSAATGFYFGANKDSTKRRSELNP